MNKTPTPHGEVIRLNQWISITTATLFKQGTPVVNDNDGNNETNIDAYQHGCNEE